MRSPTTPIFLTLASLLSYTTAKLNHLFVGNLGHPSSVYALTFDTSTHNLTLTKNITASASHHWLAFSPNKRNLYGTSYFTSELSSYSILDHGNDLQLDKVLQTPTKCHSNDTFAHIVPLPQYNVIYTASWPGNAACYLVTNTLENGTLDHLGYSDMYTNTSGIHGLALRPGLNKQFVYAADTHADVIWTHAVLDGGRLSVPTPKNVSWDGKAPRHLAAHPNGKWLYAVFEAGNSVSAYPVSNFTTDGRLGNTTTRFSLIPSTNQKTSTLDPSPPLDERWWGAEITISPSGRLLWATTRAKNGSDDTGFISAFLLSPDGEIIERLFAEPTTTKAGVANSVSVAPETDEYVANTDWKGGSGNGYVQVWKVEGLGELGVKKGDDGEWRRTGGDVGMKEVARVDIKDQGGCCANVVWYD